VVKLTWTSPGDDGTTGTASRYDIRYAATTLTLETWDSATVISSLPTPRQAGRTEILTIAGLSTGTWYFALRAADEVPNWSGLSNCVSTLVSPLALRRLTTSPAAAQVGAAAPAWSPDGESVAFCADWGTHSGAVSIYRMPSAGGTANRLTSDAAGASDGAPSWSPDGQKIAYPSGRTGGLFIVDAQPGSQPVQVISPDSGSVGAVTWSPDGSKLIYSVLHPMPLGLPWPGEIYTISPTGGTPELLIRWGKTCSDPTCSPDGTRVAFDSNYSGSWQIWVVTLAGGDPVQLTDSPGTNIGPHWSPDGTRIAFSSTRTGNPEAWVMSSNGQTQQQLTADPSMDVSGEWSPDGHILAITSRRTGVSEIWLLPVPVGQGR
jgi:Tol biopolymer transport system component